MAKRKNAVKSGLNQLRQALLQAKTAILNFSPEHILAISYDPASKATIVKDIPANLESQFTLGEGGGSSTPTPMVSIHVVNNSSEILYPYFLTIKDNVFTQIEDDEEYTLEPGKSIDIVICVPYLTTIQECSYDITGLYNSSGNVVTPVISNGLNCGPKAGVTNVLVINDDTENASCTVTYE